VRKLELKNINLIYNKQPILKGIDIAIHKGKITALIGPNGAGKSSTFRILAGLVKPESGVALYDGIELKNFSILKKHCGYLLESADFYSYLSGKKNLQLLSILTNSKANIDELLEMVGLTKSANKKVAHYSKGMKQRLGLAQVLIDDPDFLILDEPFNGLDPEVKEHILKLLVQLKNNGKGIIVSTHLLEDIESIADYFILLNDGEIHLSEAMNASRVEQQNVKLFFENPLPSTINITIEYVIKDNTILFKANKKETQTILTSLINQDLVPYKIDRSSILYDKYMEIIK
jgi:ABC-type multidrug transport system ATPase subunit